MGWSLDNPPPPLGKPARHSTFATALVRTRDATPLGTHNNPLYPMALVTYLCDAFHESGRGSALLGACPGPGGSPQGLRACPVPISHAL